MRPEEAARRPGWVGGARVVLSDGLAWSFPRPRARIDPCRVGALVWSAEGHPAPELGPKIEAITSTLPAAPTAAEVLDFVGALASLLLLRNYDLDEGRALRLLAGGFIERGDGVGWGAAFRRIGDEVIRPALADVRRARDSLPPIAEGGTGAAVGLN